MANYVDAQRLRDIVSIRWFFLLGIALTLLLPLISLETELSRPTLLIALMIILTANVLNLFQLKVKKKFSPLEISLQLGLDVLLIFALVYNHGGSHNPFALFFFMPLIQAALILPLRWSWGFSVVTCLFYLTLFINDLFFHHGHHHEMSFFWQAHLLGMIVTFIILSFFMTNFLAKTSAKLRAKEESEQEQEKLLLLGSLAAQAAHQLGTPLNSLVLLNRKIRPQISEQVADLFAQELKRCQEIIQQLADKTAFHKATQGGEVEIEGHLKLIKEQWEKHHQLPILFEKTLDRPVTLTLDQSFDYALFNLFDNAKEAGATQITLKLNLEHEQVVVDIIDNGRGFTNKEKLKDKPEGMGLGLYLTKRTMMNMRGELKNLNAPFGAHLQLRWRP